MASLGPESAMIFRITHVRNVPWILDHGLHCQSSNVHDPNFVPIGLAELIEKRTARPVSIGPRGVLADYVPFYFTPYSVMMYNITTGYNNVTKRPNSEIAILVSSLLKLKELRIPFIFTNGHAYMQETDYFDDLADLDKVDWNLLRRRDFSRDAEDPGKVGRYQAEALAYRHVPVGALLGVACYDSATKATLDAQVQSRGLATSVKACPGWYF